MLVPAVDVSAELAVEVLDRIEDPAADGLPLDESEPDFDQVH